MNERSLPRKRAPALSAVTVVGSQRARAERTLAGLADQTVVDRIESVIVDTAPSGAARLTVPGNLPVNYLSRPGIAHGADRAEGVRNAAAPIVALIEDHAVPAPEWAEALIEAHRGPWGVVGYAFAIRHAESYVARGALVSEAGQWMHPARRGEVASLAGTNVSYKREVLESMGDLPGYLINDVELNDQLTRRGFRMFLEPRALIWHEYFTSLRLLVAANFAHGRLVALTRSGGWSVWRRLLWGLGTPLSAPVVRGWRLGRTLPHRPAVWPAVATALPVVAAAYAGEAAGESIGYLLGPGRAAEVVTHAELEAPRATSRRVRKPRTSTT
jgi:Glycosyltransferase like family 2